MVRSLPSAGMHIWVVISKYKNRKMQGLLGGGWVQRKLRLWWGMGRVMQH